MPIENRYTPQYLKLRKERLDGQFRLTKAKARKLILLNYYLTVRSNCAAYMTGSLQKEKTYTVITQSTDTSAAKTAMQHAARRIHCREHCLTIQEMTSGT